MYIGLVFFMNMNRIVRAAAVLAIVSLWGGCKPDAKTLFTLVPGDDSGVEFTNRITETDSFNILTYEYIYNGGGVAVADFNKDGKQDLFFTGNEVGNSLYLNDGDFHFRDITATANVNVPGRWNSGVAVADVNNDGWPDIYVCATMRQDSSQRRNMLFIHQGLNEAGLPTFAEQAGAYGVDDYGHSMMAAFFDYDRDGDLDLYVLTNEKLHNQPTNYRTKIIDGSSPNNDRLYRNNGNNTFTNVTKEAGITIEGFGLGLAIADFNVDGWPDIYVSNDYLSNDLLYLNNRNGTFTNKIGQFIGHQSQFSMGNDAADVNNDALPDVVTLDMLPEINQRKKTTISNKSYQAYLNTEKFGYEYQYVRNMLHINGGLDKGIKFQEVGELAGVHQTEWSWSPLMADFDNDGLKDLLITNGFPKDITDKDFANYRADAGSVAGIRYLVDSIPIVKIPNYAFRNNGDLTFTDVSVPWGLKRPSFSNGAAFVDLDDDGDLDYVVNNINEEAFIYRNNLYPGESPAVGKNNYLRFRLKTKSANSEAIGAKVILRYGGHIQYNEVEPYRGFLSTVDPVVHFGVGTNEQVDTVVVMWPDGQIDEMHNVKANQLVALEESPKQGAKPENDFRFGYPKPVNLVANVSKQSGLTFKHSEADVIDYNFQRTLPHKFSQLGPGVAVGDVNGDGTDDVVFGASAGLTMSVYLQEHNGTFKAASRPKGPIEKPEEDEGLLLFDADNDNDLDLYIVSGSIEPGQSLDIFQDRLYINDGHGGFSLRKDALPDTRSSGSCVRAADIDADGDLDLFVGGRVLPGQYPFAPDSYLLRNDGGKFTNVTEAWCADLKAPGMVTDAIWSDVDSDGKVDLVVAGEFMALTVFHNDGSRFTKLTDTGLEKYTGWWNSLTAGDFDQDGDVDFIGGNLGLNNMYQVSTTYPLKVYAKDFDGNGSVDPVLACYVKEAIDGDVKKLYPVHFWDELNTQSPKFRRKFGTYKAYGQATLEQLLTPEEREGALVLEANTMTTSYIENRGKGKFVVKALPTPVQVAPVNGMVATDIDDDGDLDVVMVGNDYGNEVFSGRYDAFNGLILLGDGAGGFSPVDAARSGFYVPGDAKALAMLEGANGPLFVATQNRDSVKVFSPVNHNKDLIISPLQSDSYIEYVLGDKHVRREIYFGAGYLSQSTRKIRIPNGSTEITLYNFKGQRRMIKPAQ